MRRKFLLAVMTLSLLFCAMGAGDLYAQTEVATSDALQTALSSDGEVKLKLINNITVDATVTVAESVTATLDLNGFAITGTMHKSNGGVIKNNGSLTLIGGTIESTADNGGSALVNSGEAIVNNVTLIGAPNADGSWPSYTVNNTGVMSIIDSELTSYHGTIASYGEGAVVTMTDTDIDMSGIAGFTSHAIYTYEGGAAVVYSGNIANKATDQNNTGGSVINGAVTIYGGNFNGRVENYYGTPVIYAGTFKHGETNLDVTKYVAEGCVYNDGVVTAPEGYIFTAEQLKTALQKSGTYTLGADITVTEQIEVPFLSGDYKPVEIALNLNGHKIIADGKIYPINNNGNLTINDIEGNTGGIEGLGLLNGKDGASGNTRSAAASLTINGGTYKNLFDEGAALYAHLGSITINGGRFIGKHAAVWNENANYINISGGYFEGDYAAIINEKYIKFDKGELNGLYLGENGYSCVVSDDVIVYEARIIKNSGYTSYKTLEDAVEGATDGDVITIITNHNGSYKVPSGKNITITGADVMPFIKEMPKEPIKFANIGAHNMYGASMTFNNVTFDYYPNANYTGLQHSGNLVYNNCTFEGQPFLYGTSETFNNCTFNQNSSDAYNVWTYGAKEVAFNECIFNSAGKSVLIYKEETPGFVANVSVDKCEFNATTAVEDKAAIEMDSSLIGGINLTIDSEDTPEEDRTTATGFDEGNASGNSLWNNKKGNNDDANNNITVVVAGETVLEPVYEAQIEDKKFRNLTDAFAAATEGQTITLLGDATPALTSQRAITDAAVIDLGGKTLTLTEDDLYFGTTTFKNGKIVVDPSVKASTAVFWMFANQTLTFDDVELIATGVTGTYLIGINGGTDSSVNLLNGTKIIIDNESQAGLTAVICDNGTGNTVTIDNSDIDVKNIEGRFYLGGTSGNITVKGSDLDLNGVKEGFYLRAGQTLSVGENTTIDVVLNETEGRYGINITDVNAKYNVDETSTVNATVYQPTAIAQIGTTKYPTLQDAINAVKDGETIELLANCDETVTFTQTKDVSFVLDGNNKTYTGSINITARAGKDAPSTLVIKNFNFETDKTSHDFIKSVETNYYPNNITITGCSFEGTSDINTEGYAVVAVRLKSANKIKIEACTGTGLHSFLQNTAGWDMTIGSVEITNSLSGFAMGTIQGVNIKDCDITAKESGIRLDAQYDNQAVIESNKIEAFIPVVVRKASVNGTITFNGTNEFTETNTDGLWLAIGTSEYKENGVMPTAPTASVSVTLNDTGLDREGIYGSTLNGEGTEENPYLIETVNDLVFFRDQVNEGVNYYAGKYIALAADIDLAGENWVGIGSATAEHGFMGNFDGKTHKIKNLTITNPALDSDDYAYAAFFGVTEGTDKDNQNIIKNLTIENVTINTTGHIAAAAVAYPYYTIIDNVKVCGDIKIQGGDYTAGVLAYTRRCVNASNLSIVGNEGSFVKGNQTVGGVISDIQMNGGLTAVYNNFSAEGLTISGTKQVGGISGIISQQTLDVASVKNVTLNCSDARVGIVSGSLGGVSTVSNVVYENVTGATAIIGATYDDGKAVEAKIGDTYYATLQTAIDAAQDGTTTINILADITGDVTILQQEGKNIVIDGKKNDTEKYTFNGTINIYGDARISGEETLTIQNINFYTEDNARYFIHAYDNGQIEGTNNHKQYAHNVTVENCKFATSVGNKPNTIVGMRFRQANDMSAVNCTSDGIFSIMWTTAVDGLTLNGVEATNCTEGITIGGASKKVNIIGTTIESDTYAIRAEGAGSDFIIENSTLVAKVPVVVRNVTENSMISFTFNGTNTITESNPTNYWFVAGKKEYNGTSEEMPEAPKGQVSVTLNDTGLRYEDVYGNYYELAGEGTADNPYTIANLYELKFFRDDVNAGNNYQGKYIKVTATEIDLNNEEWTPIAYMGKTFKGNFDGNNVTVKNLKITKALTNSAENNGIGFFGRTDSPATIENIIIENVDITGSLYVGAIVGYGYTGKHVKGCTVKGDITIDAWWYAGVIGGNGYMNLIDNCHVIGKDGSYIKGNDGSYIGGIWGFRGEGNNKITNCTVTNLDIIGVDRVGGICGIGHYGNTISGCDAEDVTVTATDPEATTIGLLVGATQGNNISGEGPTIFEDNDASGITAQIDNGDGTYTEVTNLYGTNINGSTPVTNYVAQIVGGTQYATLAEAVAAAVNNDVITLLPTNAPIAMNASLYGKNVTITGTATVDWSKGNLFVGRGGNINGEGNAILTFDNANLTSASDNASTGIHVSGREKNTNNKYDGTLVINNSTIELDYLINKGTMTLDNSTLTVKNGFSVGGRPAGETESGGDATATITLNNNSKVVVNNHNGMGLGYEAIGVMNIDATSTFETTQDFLITAKGTMNVNGGNVKTVGTLTNAGTVYVTGAANLDANVTGNGWFYMNGVTLDADTKLSGAKVGFINGENTIVGSTIDNGFFSVGIGQNAAATTAATFAEANGIALGSVTVNVSENAIIGGNGEAYSGWVGSAYSADKTQHTYTLNVTNSLAAFGYMHVSKDGAMTIDGHSVNKYTFDNANVDFYAGDFIVNGNVTINDADAWVKYTKMSVDHADGVLNITGDTNYESSIHNGSTTGTSLVFYKAGKVNIAKETTIEIDNATTLVEGAELNIASNNVIAKGAVTGNGTINLTDLDAKFTAQEGLTVNNGVEGNTDYGVTYVNGAYQFAQYVAQIGEAKYLTLQEAVEAVEDGGTITLIANETFTENNRYYNSGWWDGLVYSGDKSFTIDLADFTISQDGALNDYLMWFKNDDAKDNTITLKNGTLNAGTTAYSALATSSSNTNKITINTENIEFIGNNSNGAVLKIRGGAELNVNADTKITGRNSYVGIECSGATVNIYDGAEIYQNGTSSYNGCLVGVSGNGTVNVYGGYGKGVSGGFIAMTSGGTINVYDGEWIANTDGTISNDNKGVLIAQNDKNTYPSAGQSIVNVFGGVFKGGYNCYGNTEGDAQINISGGNFNADPENYVIEGFAVETLSNSTYNVIPTSGTQTRELEAEWYWFSTYVDLNANGHNSLDIFKSAFVGEDNEVKVRQIKNQNGYVSYNSAYDIWVSDGGLLSITNTGMYMINMKESHTLELTGKFADRDLEISLNTGWNWIGYPVNEEINLTDALSELEPSTSDMIKSQTKSAIWTGSKWKVESGFDRMIPGEGYKYFRKSGATKFSYSTDVKPTSKSDDRSEEYHWIANANQYPGNMTVIAMLSIDNEIVNDNYEIAAFANGECRGSARPIYDEDLNAYILILTIQGEEVEELTFKYYDVNYGTEYELNNRINYSDDAIVGSFDEPYMFNLGILNIDESSVENISIYPNPTTTGKEINLQALCDKVEVFNALGVKVAEYTNVDSIDAIETAGIYVIRVTIDGNARNCRLIVK